MCSGSQNLLCLIVVLTSVSLVLLLGRGKVFMYFKATKQFLYFFLFRWSIYPM